MDNTQILITVVIALGLIGVASLFYFIAIYNGLITVKNNVEKYWSNIDVLLKQRFDEIPKLVAVCERYMTHEAETLEKVIKARNMMSGATDTKARAEADNFLSDTLKSLFAVTENYPELKADSRFGQLQTRITELEDEIADRRELFNASVNIHNIRIAKIPDVIVAILMGYKPKDLWQINAAHREDPGVKFSK